MDILRCVPLLSIFLPMLSGFLLLLISDGKLALRATAVITAAVAGMSVALTAYLTSRAESFTFVMGSFPAPWGNELRAGPAEALFATVYSVVLLLLLKDSSSHSLKEISAHRQSLYLAVLNLLLGSMLALIYTNDLFSAYVFLEVSTIAACSIVMVKDKGESLAESMRYLLLYMIGSTFFLLGVVLLYSVTGHLLMEPLQQAIAQLVQTGQYSICLSVSLLLMTVGLAIKSAVFPFHTVLPGAHGSAVATSSAVLSGLLLESYVIVLMKILLRVYTLPVAQSLHILDALLILGLMAMVAGSLSAMKQRNIKRMLAYSSAAQIGYIYVGIGLGSQAGMVAASFHIIAHAFTKSMLFICAGELIAHSGGSSRFAQLRGAAWRAPLAGIGFTMGGISLVGVPLLACFVSKLYLAKSAFDGSWRTVFVLVALGISMILNAMYFIPAVSAIWSGRKEFEENRRPSAENLLRNAVHGITWQMVANIALGVGFAPVVEVLVLGIALL